MPRAFSKLNYVKCPKCNAEPPWVRISPQVVLAKDGNVHRVFEQRRVYFCAKCNKPLEDIPQNLNGLN